MAKHAFATSSGVSFLDYQPRTSYIGRYFRTIEHRKSKSIPQKLTYIILLILAEIIVPIIAITVWTIDSIILPMRRITESTAINIVAALWIITALISYAVTCKLEIYDS